jgi:hypothetical protein
MGVAIVVWNGKAFELTEIERRQNLVRLQHGADFAGLHRRRVDQVAIAWKATADVASHRGMGGAQLFDPRLLRFNRILVAPGCRSRQHIIHVREQAADLFLEILLLSYEFGQCRVLGGSPRARCGEPVG